MSQRSHATLPKISRKWLSTSEVRAEFGFSRQEMFNWREGYHKKDSDGRPRYHPVLGRQIRNRKNGADFEYHRDDLELIRKHRNDIPGGAFTDKKGVTWTSMPMATAAPWYFQREQLSDWSDPNGKGCPLLVDAHGQPRKLTRDAKYVYEPEGRVRVYYFRADELDQIRENYRAGNKIISPIHGPGLSLEEVGLHFKVGKKWLQARGIKSWTEVRVVNRKTSVRRKGGLFIAPVQVWSADEVSEALKGNKTPQMPSGFISDSDAMKRWGHIFAKSQNDEHWRKDGCLATWRKQERCQWLGRKLHSQRFSAPHGLGYMWGTSISDLEEIAQAMVTGSSRKIQINGKTFLPLEEFIELSGSVEQSITDMREKKREVRALGGRQLDWKKKPFPGRRNKHKEIYLYSEEDGKQLREYKDARAAVEEAESINGKGSPQYIAVKKQFADLKSRINARANVSPLHNPGDISASVKIVDGPTLHMSEAASTRTSGLKLNAPGHPVEVTNTPDKPMPVYLVPSPANGLDLFTSKMDEIIARPKSRGEEEWDRRLQIDLTANSLTLDGKCTPNLDPIGLRIIDALRKEHGVPKSLKKVVENMLACRGGEKTARRALDKLPEHIRSLVQGRLGAGTFLQLPPIHSDK